MFSSSLPTILKDIEATSAVTIVFLKAAIAIFKRFPETAEVNYLSQISS
jgi:hypothetical protein